MKAKALRIGKAMSAALFVLLLVVVGTKNALAQTQVATLQHGDDVSVYYGTNAFVEAHTAAQTGDIITLSGGSYAPCNITKAITLHGAGCAVDTVANTTPTIFGGDIFLNVADTSNFLTIEGIRFRHILFTILNSINAVLQVSLLITLIIWLMPNSPIALLISSILVKLQTPY